MGMEEDRIYLEKKTAEMQPTAEEKVEYANKIRETLSKMKGKTGLDAKQEEKALKATEEIMVDDVPPWKALGINPEALAIVYKEGFNLYNSGKHLEALRMFNQLSLQDPRNSVYAYCKGACLHRLKQYSDAAAQYMLAASLDMTNPLFAFYASDCFIQLKEPTSAFRMLVLAMNLAEGNEVWSELYTKAKLLKEAVLLDIKPNPGHSNNNGASV